MGGAVLKPCSADAVVKPPEPSAVVQAKKEEIKNDVSPFNENGSASDCDEDDEENEDPTTAKVRKKHHDSLLIHKTKHAKDRRRVENKIVERDEVVFERSESSRFDGTAESIDEKN